MSKIVNIEKFKEYASGDIDFCLRLLGTFIEDIEEGWGVALDALEQEDYKRVQAQMHKLGGSCAAVFAVALSSLPAASVTAFAAAPLLVQW